MQSAGLTPVDRRFRLADPETWKVSARMAKTKFLVLYDYGQGGVWAYLLADSPRYIATHFPQLQIHDKPPAWMKASDLARIGATMTIDAEDWKHPFLSALAPKP